jgi:hypothetical protein
MIMNLKKVMMLIALTGFIGMPVSAQLTEKQEKQITKEAKKEAKKLKKEGWQVPAGAFSMERQLTKAYMLQEETDADYHPKYIIGQAISGGSFYDAAKMQAVELAKAELAGNIATDLTTLVNLKLGNQQISADKASSASEIIQKGKSLVSQKLGSTIPLIELFRTKGDGSVEVQIRLAYDKKKGIKDALDAIDSELEAEGVSLEE